jgi:hypothetical protein
MRQLRMRLQRRLIHPPRLNEKQPLVSHRPERVKAQAAGFLPRRPCHVAQRFLHRTLFPFSRTQPYKRVLLHAPSIPRARVFRTRAIIASPVLRDDSQFCRWLFLRAALKDGPYKYDSSSVEILLS